MFSNRLVNPKHCLTHSHKQEVDRGLASHSHRPEDGDLKVLAQARECGCHRNGNHRPGDTLILTLITIASMI